MRIDNQSDLTLQDVRPPTLQEVARLLGITNVDQFTQQDYLNSDLISNGLQVVNILYGKDLGLNNE